MAFQLTLPTMLGVIIGGVAFVFCLAVAMVVLTLRIKHRRQLARTNAAGERRLSRYPGGHLSITDEDVAQMPGARAAMRNSLCNRYTRVSAFAPLASHESIGKQASENKTLAPSRPELGHPQDRVVATESAPVSESPTRSWPLPRRLTRANRPPTMEFGQTPGSSTMNARSYSKASMAEDKPMEKLKLMPRDESLESKSPPTLYGRGGISRASPEDPTVRSPSLRPRPLFHENPRNLSHGMISEMNRRKRSGSAHSDRESQAPCAHSQPLALPRSISLTSQEPGTIPTEPVPPLPAEALVIRRQRSKKISSSRQSLVVVTSKQSPDGTVCDDTSPMTTTLETPMRTSQRSNNHLSRKHSVIDAKQLRPPVSPAIARSGTLRANMDTRKSFQASIQGSMTRSNSSGLSESLLNHGWSRSASNASMVKEATQARSKIPAGRNAGAHISVFDFGLPLRSDVDINAFSQVDSDDVQAKRRSASVLQVISGNERSPDSGSNEERPTSIATEIPGIRWSTDVLTQEMRANEENVQGLGKSRHRSKRSSNKQQFRPATRSPRASINVQRSNPQLANVASKTQSLRRPRVDPPAFRPPLKSTFEPELTQMPESKAPVVWTNPSPNPYFNDTLARLTGNDESDSSTSSPTSTPTRKPSQMRQPSGTHPNRQRVIFDGPSKVVQWPPARRDTAEVWSPQSDIDDSIVKPNNIFCLDAQINSALDRSGDSVAHVDGEKPVVPSNRPPSLLYRFPSPPSPPLRRPSSSSRGDVLSNHNKLQSFSQPNMQKQALDRNMSSFHRSISSKRSTNLTTLNNNDLIDEEAITNSPRNQLRQSVLALRRMNSEISEPSRAGREHRRYLSLGERDEPIFEDENDGNVGSGIRRIESTSTVKTVLDASAPLSLASANAKAVGTATRKHKGGKSGVRGPRAMPGWLDESMMM